MKGQIEQSYHQLPKSIQLPEGIREGLGVLSKKSIATGTEWVAAVTHSGDEYQVLPLGHQAEGEVLIPIVNLSSNARILNKKIDPEFVREESITNEWTFRYTPNEQGIYYRGSILYLLTRRILVDNPDLILPIHPPDMVIAEEDFLGVTHTHPFRDLLSHLPSLHDARDFVLGSSALLSELIISSTRVALLVKSRDTQHFEYNPDRSSYLSNQELIDQIELGKGRTYLEILRKNCRLFRIGLYSGELNSPELPLALF